MPSEDPTIYVFGDNHTDPREDVKERLHSTIPETADVVVIEHAKKGDENPRPSRWVELKNPSYAIMARIRAISSYRKRTAADRVVTGDQTTIAEEVAEELGLPVAYTDISHRRRVQLQPWYLTLLSWTVTLGSAWGILLLISAVLLTSASLFTIAVLSAVIVSVVAICNVAVTVFSTRIYHRMREKKMAKDLRGFTSDYSGLVFFTGDSHFDPIRERLRGDATLVEAPDARP